jgi:hypothetical protein
VAAPVGNGPPIEIAIGQRAKVTNAGSTTGVLSATLPAPHAVSTDGAATGPTVASGGGTGGASGQGLTAVNDVENTALVDVIIGGSNYAPINIAVRTITTIVNTARAVVETAAGGSPADSAVEGSGVGAREANSVNLEGTAAVDIAGDNHSPIRIILDIGAELWNKGMALLGLSSGATVPGSASATGLDVENILKLLGRASVRIGGSNYAPIDIEVLLQNLIYNEGTAEARSAGQAGAAVAANALETARNVSSGPASCLSLLASAGVVNGQIASVKMPVDDVRRDVLAGNTHVVDVQGYGTARCSTGDVVGSGGEASSGGVTVGGGGTVVTVVTTQVADASAKTDPAKASDAPPDGDDGTGSGTGGTGPGTTGGAGAGTAGETGATVQVVVAVTTMPVTRPGNSSATPGGRRNFQNRIVTEEETWEWIVVWEPLYVIYTRYYDESVQRTAQITEFSDTETTTSMAGTLPRRGEAANRSLVDIGGLELVEQIELALLGLLAFLLLALLKRRLQSAEARTAALRAPQLRVVTGDVADAAK